MKISQSELTLFKRCRRKWYLSVYRGLALAVERASGPAAIGTRVHAGLAEYYSSGMVDRERASRVLEEGLGADLAAYPDQERDILADADLCRAMLEGYWDWVDESGADADWEVIATERETEVAFPAVPGVSLVEKLDIRVRQRSDNARLFVDHKTVGNLSDIPKMAQLNEQFMHYGLIERLLSPETPEEWADGGVFNMLRKVKRTARARPPFYGRHPVRHNDEALRSYYRRVTGEVRDILQVRERLDAGESPLEACYPRPHRDCSWECDFFRTCYMFDDGSDVEVVLANAYTKRDPYARYTALRSEGGKDG